MRKQGQSLEIVEDVVEILNFVKPRSASLTPDNLHHPENQHHCDIFFDMGALKKDMIFEDACISIRWSGGLSLDPWTSTKVYGSVSSADCFSGNTTVFAFDRNSGTAAAAAWCQ
jgi:hypothetical protein